MAKAHSEKLVYPDDRIFAALGQFCAAVTANYAALAAGEPEAQLTNPIEAMLAAVGKALGYTRFVAKRESQAPGRLGRPDYAILPNKLLVGYIELKEPGKGANPNQFAGHDKRQWNRFKALPNLIYTDGNQWGLYRDGERIGPLVRLSGDVTTAGKAAAEPEDVAALKPLLTDFLSWQPIIPKTVKELAGLLAPLCRMLRDDVTDALKDPQSPLVQLAGEWRQLLFPDAGDAQFADAYAQTVTFALLLARSEGADPLNLSTAENALSADHSLLSRALRVLTDPNAQAEISAPLNLLLRVIGEVPQDVLKAADDEKDPWLFFYEDFLAAYDPELRKNAGAYYTPVEVVRAQVRLIDDLLTNRLGKSLGFADPAVITLDPAAGTGTYLLGVIDHALAKVQARQGAGAVAGQATALAKNIYGFEIMVGPFAVSELRVSRALADRGATLPRGGSHVYLTDTLESPHATPSQLPLYLKPIADQHAKALKVKSDVPVIVCLGNPPYDRHEAADETNKARTGHWVRWGDDNSGPPILRDFTEPAKQAGHGGHLKNLYNLYVYFWRWALWKVFESKTAAGPGIVSFISASSYLDGDAFSGMREHMRRQCDEIWVLDLGGEGRGTRRTENVFAIQTPVAIAVAVRYGRGDTDQPAMVHHAAIVEGTREEKLRALNAIDDFAALTWETCPDDWHAPFRPAGTGTYFEWPLMTDLLPWQHSGIECKRTWPISPDERALRRRWRALMMASDRASMFRETGDRTVSRRYAVTITPEASTKPIATLPTNAPSPPVLPYGFRSFDRQLILADARLMSRPRPDLWRVHGERQIYLASQTVLELGKGPALTVLAHPPDRHYFAGRGGKDIFPFFRDAGGIDGNILPGLLDLLSETYSGKVTPDDFAAYVYGVLAQPAFTRRFADELATRELRVPMTKNADLFERVRQAGAKLLWLHTYGERFVPKGKHRGQVPRGPARCIKAVPGEQENYPERFEYEPATKTLRVGGGEFAPVSPQVYEFEVSGLKVVQSWLGYRMKDRRGRRSSPLDEITPATLGGWPSAFTTELLELLWVLEATVAEYPAQAELLEAVVQGPCFTAAELPEVPAPARKPPARPAAGLFQGEADEG